jgi:RNA polymerase sigma-W factor
VRDRAQPAASPKRRKSQVKEEDILLIERCRGGDEAAYRALLKKYDSAVFSICFRMVRNREEARDLAQDVFIKVFRMLDRYNPTYAFSSWLFKITANLCIDAIRKKRVTVHSIDEPVEQEGGTMTRQYEAAVRNPEETVIDREHGAMIAKAVEKLPEHYRIIILLRHQEQLAYEEIAEVLRIPLGTVKARIHRAREMLKVRLRRMGVE